MAYFTTNHGSDHKRQNTLPKYSEKRTDQSREENSHCCSVQRHLFDHIHLSLYTYSRGYTSGSPIMHWCRKCNYQQNKHIRYSADREIIHIVSTAVRSR